MGTVYEAGRGDFGISAYAEIQNYLLPYGSWDPEAMILMGPRALGMGPIIDVCIH